MADGFQLLHRLVSSALRTVASAGSAGRRVSCRRPLSSRGRPTAVLKHGCSPGGAASSGPRQSHTDSMLTGSMFLSSGRLQPAQAVPATAAAAGRWRRQQPLQLRPLQQQQRQLLRQQQRNGAASVEFAPTSIEIENIVYEDGCYTVQGCMLTPCPADTVYQVGAAAVAWPCRSTCRHLNRGGRKHFLFDYVACVEREKCFDH